MENFVFSSPTQYILQKDAHKLAGKLVAKKSKNVLLVYADDDFMHSSGLYQDILQSLQKAGLKVYELTGVQPNPRISLVRQGVQICKDNSIGYVLAVGGGSVVDTAKAAALGACHSGDVWEFFTGDAQPQESLPVGTVMTLPATGSEASNGTVISNEYTGEKKDVMSDVVRPDFCLMNPELTFSLPKSQTAYGIADMFSHVAERYFGAGQNGVQLTDRLCEGTMLAILECGKLAMQNGQNYDARANLMWSAIVAHNGILGTGRNQEWCTHMIGAPVSGIYNSVHGGTISVIMPVWMEYVYDADPELFARFATRVFGVPQTAGNTKTVAKMGINALRNFFKELGLPQTLQELGVQDDTKFGIMAERACFGGVIGGIKPLAKEDIISIYRLAF